MFSRIVRCGAVMALLAGIYACFMRPVKTAALDIPAGTRFVPSGETVGIVLDTDGVLVLGTGRVRDKNGREYEPCRGILRSGDMIKSVNGRTVFSKEELSEAVKSDPAQTSIVTDRAGEVTLQPIQNSDGVPMIGLWVRDSTQGIGTVTYYRQDDGAFGALGHPVTDIDTGKLMQIRTGELYPVLMQGIVKGEKGSAGELSGQNAYTGEPLGIVDKNCKTGVYGHLSERGKSMMQAEAMPVAFKESIHRGKASILADVDGSGVCEYSISIDGVNRMTANTAKGMTIRITDPELIKKTGGIVQGMSGSPIIQDGRLIGAVTHVFVQDPTRGYGIFIENMLTEH